MGNVNVKQILLSLIFINIIKKSLLTLLNSKL